MLNSISRVRIQSGCPAHKARQSSTTTCYTCAGAHSHMFLTEPSSRFCAYIIAVRYYDVCMLFACLQCGGGADAQHWRKHWVLAGGRNSMPAHSSQGPKGGRALEVILSKAVGHACNCLCGLHALPYCNFSQTALRVYAEGSCRAANKRRQAQARAPACSQRDIDGIAGNMSWSCCMHAGRREEAD